MKSVSRYWTQKSRFSNVPLSCQSTSMPANTFFRMSGTVMCWKIRLWARFVSSQNCGTISIW